MRTFQIILASAFLLTSVQAFAHHDEACKSYADTCKADPSVTGATGKAKWKAMDACVTGAAKADTANGQKCLDEKAKHHKGHHHEGGDSSGAAPAQGN